MLAENLSYLSEDEIAVVMHPRHGITAKTSYLPTWEQVLAVLKEDEERQRKFKPSHTHYQRFASVCTEADALPPSKPFQPFPRLNEAFKEEPWLMKNKTFDTLFDASRSLAMFGKDAARDVLQMKVGA